MTPMFVTCHIYMSITIGGCCETLIVTHVSNDTTNQVSGVYVSQLNLEQECCHEYFSNTLLAFLHNWNNINPYPKNTPWIRQKPSCEQRHINIFPLVENNISDCQLFCILQEFGNKKYFWLSCRLVVWCSTRPSADGGH